MIFAKSAGQAEEERVSFSRSTQSCVSLRSCYE